MEALLIKMKHTESDPVHFARYIAPERFIWRRFPNPSARVSGRLEYTMLGNLLYHNGAGTDADFSYIKYPYIADASVPLLLATFTHQAIVDRAAYLLYRKEVGIPDHEAAGNNAELQLIDRSPSGA